MSPGGGEAAGTLPSTCHTALPSEQAVGWWATGAMVTRMCPKPGQPRPRVRGGGGFSRIGRAQNCAFTDPEVKSGVGPLGPVSASPYYRQEGKT